MSIATAQLRRDPHPQVCPLHRSDLGTYTHRRLRNFSDEERLLVENSRKIFCSGKACPQIPHPFKSWLRPCIFLHLYTHCAQAEVMRMRNASWKPPLTYPGYAPESANPRRILHDMLESCVLCQCAWAEVGHALRCSCNSWC